MLAPALRDCTAPGPFWTVWLTTGRLLIFAALPPCFARRGDEAAGRFTPAKSVPRIRVTAPGLPTCQAGSASVLSPAGNDVSAVINVYALSAWSSPE